MGTKNTTFRDDSLASKVAALLDCLEEGEKVSLGELSSEYSLRSAVQYVTKHLGIKVKTKRNLDGEVWVQRVG